MKRSFIIVGLTVLSLLLGMSVEARVSNSTNNLNQTGETINQYSEEEVENTLSNLQSNDDATEKVSVDHGQQGHDASAQRRHHRHRHHRHHHRHRR